jgi:hypothetical protein
MKSGRQVIRMAVERISKPGQAPLKWQNLLELFLCDGSQSLF